MEKIAQTTGTAACSEAGETSEDEAMRAHAKSMVFPIGKPNDAFAQYFVNCVALFKYAPTIKDMADLLGCSHQNAKQILSKLEKQGFANVYQDPSDKRKQRILLTEKAEEFRRHYDKPSGQAMQSIFENISEEELLTTISVFTRLNKNVDQRKGQVER